MSITYAIGPFTLDPSAGVLGYGDRATPLGARGVAVLAALVEQAPQFVSREAILERAWPGLVVDASNLATQVSAIRRALAEAPEAAGWIETLARRGYRFVGPVTIAGAAAPLRAARAGTDAPEGRRRQHVALLDVRLPAAEAAGVAGRGDRSSALACMAAEVRRFGGQIDGRHPNGLRALFGLGGSDNPPAQAAAAALAIRHLLTAETGPLAQALAAAPAWVQHEQGRPVLDAADRQALADELAALFTGEPDGQILIGRGAQPFLRRGFRTEPWPSTGGTRLLAAGAADEDRSRFIGRQVERDALAAAAARAAEGQAQIVGIVGEAGVGKSRLVHELLGPLRGWQVMEGACAPHAQQTAYVPLAQALAAQCGVQPGDTAATVRQRVADALPAGAGEPARLLPPLFDVLGVLADDDPLRALDPALRRRRTHDALRQVLLATSMAAPLCLVVEDLHWVDLATREVLDGLVSGMTGARLLLLATYRPEFQHGWAHRPGFQLVRLEPLAPTEADHLLDALLGPDPALGPLKRRLAAHGNPFYLEESVRALAQAGTLQGSGGRFRLVRPVQELEVPATVQAILAARAAQLPPEEHRLLQVAAAIGRDVPLTLLEALADLPEEPLRRHLEALQTAGFLRQTGLHPHLRYGFVHALTHEVIDSGLAPARQRTLHARIAEAIERLDADRLPSRADSLARHAWLGECWDQAAHWLRQAGLQALARADNRTAAALFEQALAALAKLEPTPRRRTQAIDLCLDVRTALIPLGAFDRIAAVLQQARQDAEALGDRRRQGEALAFLCHLGWMTGRLAEALAHGRAAQAIAEALGERPLLVLAHLQLGATCMLTGDLDPGATSLERVQRLLDEDPAARRFPLADAAAISARVYLSQIHATQGRFDTGRELADTAMQRAARQERPYDLANARICLARLHVGQGALDQAIDLLLRDRSTRDDWDMTIFSALTADVLGHAYVLSGRMAEGLRLLQHALHAIQTMRYGAVEVLAQLHLAEAECMDNRPAEALRRAEQALVMVRSDGRRSYGASALHLRGVIHAALGQPEAAGIDLTAAQEMAMAMGMWPLVAHGHRALARLHRQGGRHEAAVRHGEAADTLYARLGMRHRWAQDHDPGAAGRDPAAVAHRQAGGA